MKRTQTQLPDELAQRAKDLAVERKKWQLPRVNGGGIKVPLEKLRELMADDETTRSLRRP